MLLLCCATIAKSGAGGCNQFWQERERWQVKRHTTIYNKHNTMARHKSPSGVKAKTETRKLALTTHSTNNSNDEILYLRNSGPKASSTLARICSACITFVWQWREIERARWECSGDGGRQHVAQLALGGGGRVESTGSKGVVL